MRRRILFLVNGLGLGNSTRSHAIIQKIVASGAEVEVVTSNNGAWFFADKPEIAGLTEIPTLRYGSRNGRISIAATLAGLGEMRAALRKGDELISDAIARFRPHAVVTDSVYSSRPARRAGVALAALNNSDMVVRGMARFRDWPANVLPQFLAIEMADFLYHLSVPDLVVSPRLSPEDMGACGTFRPVGPIVREACTAAELHSGPPRRVVIMLSGSVFGTPVTLRRPHPGITIDVIGRPAPAGGHIHEGVTYHGKLRDSLPLLRAADLVIVNGGFSAVSEILCMRKPMVVISVPRHAEQWVNGRTIRQLGVGLTATEGLLEDAMEEALAGIDRLRAACRVLPELDNGAEQAANMILALAERDRA